MRTTPACPMVSTKQEMYLPVALRAQRAELLPHLGWAPSGAPRGLERPCFSARPTAGCLALLTLRARSVAQFLPAVVLSAFSVTSPINPCLVLTVWMIPFAVPNRHWGRGLVALDIYL